MSEGAPVVDAAGADANLEPGKDAAPAADANPDSGKDAASVADVNLEVAKDAAPAPDVEVGKDTAPAADGNVESGESNSGRSARSRKRIMSQIRKATHATRKNTKAILASASRRTKKTRYCINRMEGRLQYLLVNLPIAGPLTAALLCTYLLIFQDVQPPLDTPWLFQLSFLFCFLSILGWLLVQVVYGLFHCYRGLHPRQTWLLTLFLLASGSGIFVLRMGHIPSGPSHCELDSICLPGHDSLRAGGACWRRDAQARLLQLLRTYADVAPASLCGHHHTESLRVLRDDHGAARHIMYLSPALTPRNPRHDPAVRLYQLTRKPEPEPEP